MTTFVLVHGAWHGPWAWTRVAELLQRDGAETLTPELRFDADAGLHDHALQVAATLDGITDRDVTLVGHSYAGLVVRQAADMRADRVSQIVLIDAWAGRAGASLLELAPESFVAAIHAAVQASTDRKLIPPPPPAAFGIAIPADAQWLASRLRPHPLRTFAERTELTGAVDRIPGMAICCRPVTYPFDRFAVELGYPVTYTDGPHDIMLTGPKALAGLLRRLLATSEMKSRNASRT